MSSISSLSKMVSGLQAAQKGLQVTGHNLSNVNTTGYTRQQLLQQDSHYLTIGSAGNGDSLKVGSGVTQTEIRQIRDALADKRIRTENSVLNYHQTISSTLSEVSATLDEPYGEGVTNLLNNFWSQAQKLNTTPDGVEERQSFIRAASVLITKINDISDTLTTYQMQLNTEVKDSVKRLNELFSEIRDCNNQIAEAEVNGDNANDYRDQRNLLLDELSAYGNIEYYEEADHRMVVKFEGTVVVNKQYINEMSIKERDNSPFGTPIWESNGKAVFDMSQQVSTTNANDAGSLKALLVARGNELVTEETTWSDIALNDNFSVDVSGNSYLIPKILKELQVFTQELVTVVNEAFDGYGIGKDKEVQGTPVFVAKEGESLVPGNIQVNAALLESGGYNLLGTVSANEDGTSSGNSGDPTKISEFLQEWTSNRDWYKDVTDTASPSYKKVSMTSFYSEFVTKIGSEESNATSKAEEKYTSVQNIENERQAISGVSQDEEFSNMLKYQYAYNASARMITMLDGMLDTIINGL